MGILLVGGTWWDSEQKQWRTEDIFIQDGLIKRIERNLTAILEKEGEPLQNVEIRDCSNQIITPGLIDMHVHLREPGFEYKETIESGTRAAAAGGFTTVACMPNTRPSTDTPDKIRWIYDRTQATGSCRVLPYGAITLGQRGDDLTDFAGMKAAGAVGFTDDGVGVQVAGMMRQAMERAAAVGLPIVIHAEDESLALKGCMNEGEVSNRLGLPGIPGEAESVQIARDALLAKKTGAHLHVCHISDATSVEVVRFAKAQGVHVTAEVTPHHLLLTDEQIDGLDANWKVNPPLRTEADRIACLEGLLDGTIDMIATDHAPHADEEKERPFQIAPFGFIGSEFAFPLLYTRLVVPGTVSLELLLEKMSTAPAQVFGLQGGRIHEGAVADITVIDTQMEQTISRDKIVSKGKNTPFLGETLRGWPTLTMVAGRVTYDRKG